MYLVFSAASTRRYFSQILVLLKGIVWCLLAFFKIKMVYLSDFIGASSKGLASCKTGLMSIIKQVCVPYVRPQCGGDKILVHITMKSNLIGLA